MTAPTTTPYRHPDSHCWSWIVGSDGPLGSWSIIVPVCALGILAGLLPWPWLIGSAAVFLAVLDPIFGLAWLVLSVTAQDTISIGGLSLTQVAAALALASWSLRILAHPERPLGLGRSAGAWGVFLIILLLATSLSPYSPSEGLKELWRWSVAYLAWLIAATMLEHPWQRAVIVLALLGGPLVNALIGLEQFVAGEGPPTFLIPGTTFSRAYGTIGQPNSFAGYMNLA